MQNKIQLFQERQVRSLWDDEAEEWYFSIVDVVGILTDSVNPTVYWRKLKQRLKAEGNETVTNCHGLKMKAADGKMRMTDVATTEQLFRIIQSIPSPKAEPFKLWIAEVAAQRIDQMQDPELSIDQAMTDYKRLGYSDNWINQRLKSIEIRKDLTDEWKKHGLQEGMEFGTLTDIIYKTWSDKTAKEYKQFKGLKKENLRDNMTNKELVLNMLAELSTKEISESTNPESFSEHTDVAKRGGKLASLMIVCLSMSAQGLKGVWFAGGNVNFGKQEINVTSGVEKVTQTSIMPLVGRFISPTVAVGGALGYSQVKHDDLKSNTYTIMPLARKYWNIAGNL